MYRSSSIALLAAAAATQLQGAFAGFNNTASDNVAAYWGQGAEYKRTLHGYCSNRNIDIIPIAFLVNITDPVINLAATGDQCSEIKDSKLLNCTDLGAAINNCQEEYNKTIILSVGGPTYSEGGWKTEKEAVAAALLTWKTFGPEDKKQDPPVPRTFGNATVNGFDLYFHSNVTNAVAYANELRRLMDEANNSTETPPQQPFILTASPQCPLSDNSTDPLLNGTVSFDALMVQFFNNKTCDLSNFDNESTPAESEFNLAAWDTWATTKSKNKHVKILIGIAGSEKDASAGGYVNGTDLADVVGWSDQLESYGGLSVYSLASAEKTPGFLRSVYKAANETQNA